MAIRRRPGPPQIVTPIAGNQTVYSVELSATPSPPWRAAFLRPPARLTRSRYTPELGRLSLDGATVLFRTAPDRLERWQRRIDRWVQYANSVVET